MTNLSERELLNGFDVLFAYIDHQGVLQAIQGGLIETLGIDRKEMLGSNPFASGKLPVKKGHFRKSLLGLRFSTAVVMNKRHFETTLVPRFEGQRVVGVMIYATDVGKIHQVDQSIDRDLHSIFISQHLFSLSQTLNGISHEINNPLAIISGYAQNLQTLVDNSSQDMTRVMDITRKISKACRRCSRIIDSLKTFARNGNIDPEQLQSVRSILDKTLELVDGRIRSLGIIVHLNYVPGDLQIRCRETLLVQAMYNVVLNAIDSCKKVAYPEISIEIVEDIKSLSIFISDNGPGVPGSIRNRIFEPFFTTKEIGKGAGIGLSWAIGAVEIHGGQLSLLDADPTTFRIVLPKYGAHEAG